MWHFVPPGIKGLILGDALRFKRKKAHMFHIGEHKRVTRPKWCGVTNYIKDALTHIEPMFPFGTPWNHQETVSKGEGGRGKREYWLNMS